VTFEETRADFEAAWNVLLPTRTEADFRSGATSVTGCNEDTQ
jgi:hypothetical protein